MLLLFSCLLTSCSTITEFIVVNHSNDPVEISYSLKECTDDFQFPGRLTSEEFEENREWNFLDVVDSAFDSRSCSFSIELKANEVLLVERVMNYSSESEKGQSERFNLKSINVDGKKGRISLEGTQVEAHFVNDSGKYLMIYK